MKKVISVIMVFMMIVSMPVLPSVYANTESDEINIDASTDGELPEVRYSKNGAVERLFFVNFYNDDGSILYEDIAFYTGDGVHYPSETPPIATSNSALLFNYWGDEAGNEINLTSIDPTNGGLVAGAVVDLYAYYTVGEQAPADITEYTIQYVNDSGEEIADPYKVSLQQGVTIVVPHKNITGYAIKDTAVSSVTLGEDPTTTLYNVVYVDNTQTASYIVKHEYPNIGGASVVTEQETFLDIPVGSIVYAHPKDKEGFISTGEGQLSNIVSPSNNTTLTVEYLRKKNYILIDSAGGTQVAATTAEYGEGIDLSYLWDVQRTGFELSHYIDVATGTKYVKMPSTGNPGNLLPTTMPADSMTLQAVWTSDDAEVIVTYYVERLDVVGKEPANQFAEIVSFRPLITEATFPGSLTPEQIESDETWEVYSTTTTNAKTGQVLDEAFLEQYKSQVPGAQDGIEYRKFTKSEFLDASGNTATTITGNGSTRINLYYESIVYMAQFQVGKSDDVNGVFTYETLIADSKTYTEPTTGVPANVNTAVYTDVETGIVHKYTITNASPHLDNRYYSFFYKYGQNIEDKWPYPDGTKFILSGGGEVSNYYGWRTGATTLGYPDKEPFETIVYTSDINVAGDALMAKASNSIITFFAVGTSQYSDINIYLEPLEGAVMEPGSKEIEFEGNKYYNLKETDTLSPGINYVPNVIPGFTNVSSYNEIDSKGKIVPVDGVIDADGAINYLKSYKDLNGDEIVNDLAYDFIYERNDYDITFNTGYASTFVEVKDIPYQTELLPVFENNTTIGGTAESGWLPAADVPPEVIQKGFLGWSHVAQNNRAELPEELRFEISDLNTMPAHDVTVYAWWDIETFNVTYKSDQDDSGTVIEYQYGTPLVIPLSFHNLTKEGHIFLGWTLDDSDEIIAVPVGDPVVQNRTYTVQWQEVSDLNLEIVHKYTDTTGKEYTYRTTLQDQLLDFYVGAVALSTKQLREKGFPTNLFYTPDNHYISHKNTIMDNVLVFEYTADENAIYNVIHVDELGVPVGNGIDIENAETDLEILTLPAANIPGYTPIETIIRKDFINETTNTFIFVYKEEVPQPSTISVNFYTPAGSTFKKDFTLESQSYKLGQTVENILVDVDVAKKLEEYLFRYGYVASASTITSKVIASNTQFNIYLTKENLGIEPLVVEAKSIVVEYNSKAFELPLDDIIVTIYGKNFTIQEAQDLGVDIKIVDIPPHLQDGTEENLIGKTISKDVKVTDLWVVATQMQGDGTLVSAMAGFTHTVNPYPVTIMVDSYKRDVDELDPITFTYQFTHNAFFASDEININITKTQETPDIGSYPGILVPTISGNDVGNYAITTVNGNVEIVARHTVTYPGVNPTPGGELPEESFEVEDGDKVIVDNNDGTPPKELIIEKDTIIEEPTRDGYIFEGYIFDPTTNTLTATWSKQSPGTGDNTQTIIWVALLGGAGIVAGGLIIFGKKKKNK